MIRSKNKIWIFSLIVVVYMLAALTWWAILLINKTNTIYALRSQSAHLESEIAQEQVRQQYMIAGEGIVFAAALVLGVILLNRAFKREMVAVKQQKNFLLSVTHELKSPITAIRLILDTFKKRNLDRDKMQLLIDNGQEEAERLNKLVEDLLTASRLSPKNALTTTTFSLKNLTRELISQYERNYPEFNFKLAMDEGNLSINTNEPSLNIIISNLLDNAVKYSGTSKEIEISLRKKQQFMVLSVADYGKGIPDNEKDRIFDQFYRVGEEDVRTAKGTGLGLYLVSELSRKLGIKVNVKNNKPEGSIFELVIPIKNEV